jgi:hypothetical protein
MGVVKLDMIFEKSSADPAVCLDIDEIMSVLATSENGRSLR